MEQPIALDDWGSAWVYRQVGEKAPEGKFDLISVGPDKEEGTEDDINVWPKSALEGVEGSGGSSDSPPAASPRRLSPAMCLSASLGVSTEAYVRVRAFTLIELMIALAIVAMLAGIVLPIGLSRLNADAFAQAQRQVEAAVGIARADAQRTGVHVKLIAVVDGGVVLFSQAHGAADRPDTSGKRSLPRREFVLELPTGVQIESEPDTEEEHANQDGDEVRTAREGSASASDGSSATELALCVLMPDGTVVPGEPVLLVARDGKRARIEFNPWTGALTFLPVTAAHVAGAADASAPAPDPTRGPGGESGLSNEDAP